MKNKGFILLGLVLMICACSKQEARRPVSHSSSKKVYETVELHRKILAHQNALIENFIRTDSLHVYQKSKKGFSYRYLLKKEMGAMPVKGDKVYFEQAIFSLNGALLYSSEELGTQEYLVDKEYVIKGIREGIKLMKEGEELLFALPSFLAYRSKGDEKNRIGSNQPILIKLKLTKIINENNENKIHR
jgi:gliding motility-associated peptidyl-prolyl isomerase